MRNVSDLVSVPSFIYISRKAIAIRICQRLLEVVELDAT